MGDRAKIYTARMDVEADYLERFKRWYATQHAPDLIAAGFYSCQAYYSEIGRPLVCNVYEIAASEIFSTQAYQDARTRDPQRAEVLSKLSNRSNSVYDQVCTVGHGAGEAGPVSEPILTTLRFDVPEGQAEALIAWYEGREFPRLRAVSGFVSARLCRQNGTHPSSPSRDPAWLVLAEWPSAAAARQADSPEEVVARYGTRFPGMGALAYNLVHRDFALTRRRAC